MCMTKRKKTYNGEFGTQCPVCSGGKLSCPQAKSNFDKSVLYRERECDTCGTRVADTVIKRREILRKESIPG